MSATERKVRDAPADWAAYAYAVLLAAAAAGLVVAGMTLDEPQAIVEFVAILSSSAGALCVLVGVGFAWVEWQARAGTKDAVVRASGFRPLEAGISVGDMAELAKALKGLAQSIQSFFVGALFFLVAGALVLGSELAK
jgi:hypothetical protein